MHIRSLSLFWLLAVFSVSAAPVWNDSGAFLRPGAGKLHNSEKRGQNLEFAAAPDGKPGARLTWDSGRFGYAEVNLPSPVVLDASGGAEVSLDYYSEGFRQVTGFGMRVADATGEVFQWTVPAGDDRPGWKTVQARLSPGSAGNTWGGNKDKVLDPPARIIGFAVTFAKESAGPVWLGAFRYRIPGEQVKIPALAWTWTFDERTEWWKSRGAARMAGKEIAAARRGEVFLSERMFAVRKAENGRELRLYCTLESGAADVSIFVFDAKGKRQELAPFSLKTGKNRAVFPLEGLAFPLRFDTVRINGGDGGFKVAMERLELWELKESAAAIGVAVDTGHPLHLLLPGDGTTAALILTNRSEQPLGLDGEFRVSDYLEECLRFEKKIDLPPGGELRIPVDASKFVRDGIYYIDYSFGEGVSGRTSFARMTPAGPTPGTAKGFLFGICTHTERWSERDQELEVLAGALSGAKVIRTGPGWGQVQPKKDAWDYTLFDRLVGLYGDSGMELQISFGLCTHWGKADDAKLRNGEPDLLTNGRSMPDLDAWRAFIRNTVSRYRGKIRYWEVWNEPDIGFANFGVADYVRLLAASYEEAKQAAPEALVLNGGFAGLTAPAQIAYQRRFLETAKGNFDIHAFHQHGDFGVFRRVIDEVFLPQRRESGTTAPWYANETALHSLGGQEQLQAETLFTKLIFAWARGAIGYTWYDLRNDGFSETDAEHNYGMMTNDFYPKAVYPAFAALVNTYRDMNFDREITLGNGEYAFLFRGENRLALAAWREVSAADSTSGLYLGATDGNRVRRVDIMGNPSEVALESGRFLFQPGRTPESLVIEGGTELSFTPILKVRTVGPAAPGRTFALEFELECDTELRLQCELSAAPPFLTEQKNFELKSVPGQTNIFRRNILVTGDPGADVRRIPLRIAIPGGGEAEIAIPVYPARKLSPALGEKPDFVLDRRIQVTSLYDKEPNRSIWQGPQDLSAKIFCGIERDVFVVRAEVTDDVHRQNDSGKEIWKGDSIQLFFQLPGQKGTWELGGALTASGTASHVWNAPENFDAAAANAALKVNVSRTGTRTGYEFRIPFKAIGLTAQMAKEGFRFNLLVNDSDVPGDEREGWIRIAPGAGDERKPLRYPVIFFE